MYFALVQLQCEQAPTSMYTTYHAVASYVAAIRIDPNPNRGIDTSRCEATAWTDCRCVIETLFTYYAVAQCCTCWVCVRSVTR